MSAHALGRAAEQRAADYLSAQGLTILARNYRAARAEVDIIARDGEMIVFVEVKARSNDRFGQPREAVTLAKQRRVIRAALQYLADYAHPDVCARFDVVEILGSRIEHWINAFDATGAEGQAMEEFGDARR